MMNMMSRFNTKFKEDDDIMVVARLCDKMYIKKIENLKWIYPFKWSSIVGTISPSEEEEVFDFIDKEVDFNVVTECHDD